MHKESGVQSGVKHSYRILSIKFSKKQLTWHETLEWHFCMALHDLTQPGVHNVGDKGPKYTGVPSEPPW